MENYTHNTLIYLYYNINFNKSEKCLAVAISILIAIRCVGITWCDALQTVDDFLLLKIQRKKKKSTRFLYPMFKIKEIIMVIVIILMIMISIWLCNLNVSCLNLIFFLSLVLLCFTGRGDIIYNIILYYYYNWMLQIDFEGFWFCLCTTRD